MKQRKPERPKTLLPGWLTLDRCENDCLLLKKLDGETETVSSSNVIELDGAVKDYGNNKRMALQTLVSKVARLVGFLGPNGSGKTTCIRLIPWINQAISRLRQSQRIWPIGHHVEALRKRSLLPRVTQHSDLLNPTQFLNLISHELNFPENLIRSDEIKRVLELVGLREYSETKDC